MKKKIRTEHVGASFYSITEEIEVPSIRMIRAQPGIPVHGTVIVDEPIVALVCFVDGQTRLYKRENGEVCREEDGLVKIESYTLVKTDDGLAVVALPQGATRQLQQLYKEKRGLAGWRLEWRRGNHKRSRVRTFVHGQRDLTDDEKKWDIVRLKNVVSKIIG